MSQHHVVTTQVESRTSEPRLVHSTGVRYSSRLRTYSIQYHGQPKRKRKEETADMKQQETGQKRKEETADTKQQETGQKESGNKQDRKKRKGVG